LQDIAIVSILLLSWSDTAASTFGRLYGKYGPSLRPGKSLIGSLAAMATGALAAYVYWGLLYPRYESHVPAHHFYWSKHSIFDFSFTREGSVSWTRSTSKLALWELCSLTGLVAGLSEAVDVWGLDDNLVIPVLSASMLRGAIWLLSKVK
jgi:diacylglycerol kinase (CTP)